ncbi:MAG TPA: tRNA uridine-5-carboxymethylaminomethyl(34) synthesis GTPase MnmE [Bacteroidales bacterium]|nr:tRNA uridine-5-carboxymethylaminomethyl(34) synthesis GTPase MnmE [Bacteroidales bacterium]
MYLANDNTICAIATPQGIGAVSMVRVSGAQTLDILKKLTHREQFNIRQAYLCEIFDDNDKLLDDAVIIFYKAPHSYTGEDVAEIFIHGSLYIQKTLLETLINWNVKLAEPGEFTYRAFINGKMDLLQAEAVNDLVFSTNSNYHDIALNQLRGGFSKKLNIYRTELINLTALLELEIDFAEEDVEFASRDKLKSTIIELIAEADRLIDSYKNGNVVKRGIPIAIIGNPNVGKSTLLNAILNDEKAIVSEIPGTTRDAIEDQITYQGFSFRFIDTAGLQTTNDIIENIGIERSYDKMRESFIILYLIDITEFDYYKFLEDLQEMKNQIKDFDNKKMILVFNKIDLIEKIPSHLFDLKDYDKVFISAKRKENLEILLDEIVNSIKNMVNLNEDTLINIRHYEAFKEIKLSLTKALEDINKNMPNDIVAFDLRQSIDSIGRITGEIVNNDILDHIFANFCIGK